MGKWELLPLAGSKEGMDHKHDEIVEFIEVE